MVEAYEPVWLVVAELLVVEPLLEEVPVPVVDVEPAVPLEVWPGARLTVTALAAVWYASSVLFVAALRAVSLFSPHL